MALSTPHFQMPFQFNLLTGKPPYVEQDEPEDVASCVLNILSCAQGASPYDPQFGVPSILFAQITSGGLDASGLVAAVAQYEPRLTNISATQAIDLIDNAVSIVLTGTALPTQSATN